MKGQLSPDEKVTVYDKNFEEWVSGKISELGEHIKGVYESNSTQRSEDIIRYVNRLLSDMCLNVPLFHPKRMVLHQACLRKADWRNGHYVWYPALLRKRDCTNTLDETLVLGICVYKLTLFRKREVFNDTIFLSYNILRHSPETKKAYKKCVEAIPALLLEYVDFIVETLTL